MVEHLNVESKKQIIGKKASQLIKENDIVFLGSGITVASMLVYLQDRHDIYIITNNLWVINEAQRYSLRTMVIGGNLNVDTWSFVGTQSINASS